MKFTEYNDSLIRPRGNYFALLVLGLALCCPLAIYFLNPVATAYVSDGFLQLSPLWIPLAGLGAVLALTGLVYMVRMIADLPVEEKKEVTEAGVALEAARVARLVLEERFKLNNRKLGLYILKHIVLYTLVGGGLAGVIGWLAAGGNLAGVFGVVGPDAVYVNIAFVIGLSLLAWKFLAWGSDHTSRIFTIKSLQWRHHRFNEEKSGIYKRFEQEGKEFNKDASDSGNVFEKGKPGPHEEQFKLDNSGFLGKWQDHPYMRKAAWKDNIVMLLWAGYLATIPYLAHTIHWFNSDFATGVALVFFAVSLQLFILSILSFKKDFTRYRGKPAYIERVLSRYRAYLKQVIIFSCIIFGTLFGLGATGVIVINDPAVMMVILPSILLAVLSIKFLIGSLFLAASRITQLQNWKELFHDKIYDVWREYKAQKQVEPLNTENTDKKLFDVWAIYKSLELYGILTGAFIRGKIQDVDSHCNLEDNITYKTHKAGLAIIEDSSEANKFKEFGRIYNKIITKRHRLSFIIPLVIFIVPFVVIWIFNFIFAPFSLLGSFQRIKGACPLAANAMREVNRERKLAARAESSGANSAGKKP